MGDDDHAATRWHGRQRIRPRPGVGCDRERAIDVLKDAFAEGRLTGDEHAERVERAYGSRTYAELAAVSGDLPAGPPGSPPSQARPGPAGYLLRGRTDQSAGHRLPGLRARGQAQTRFRSP